MKSGPTPSRKPKMVPATRAPRGSARARSAPARNRALPLAPKIDPIIDLGERYKVCIMDPPWGFKTYSKKGTKKNPKYDVMDFDELRALRPTVDALLAKDAVVLMWVTAPQLANGIALLAEYGLEYKSYMVWDKKRQAMGYWARSNCEIVLVATRGKPGAPKMGTQGLSLFTAPAKDKRHSSKPHTLHEWAEKHYPGAKKLEMFARDQRDGWTCLGGDLGFWLTAAGVSMVKPGEKTNVLPFPVASPSRGRR